MGTNCSSCNCNWSEDFNSEIKDLITCHYKKRDNSLVMKSRQDNE